MQGRGAARGHRTFTTHVVRHVCSESTHSTSYHASGDLSTILGPLILATDLLFLLGGEVIDDIEGLADLFRRLALDHIGDGLAADIEERLDIKIVGRLRQCI